MIAKDWLGWLIHNMSSGRKSFFKRWTVRLLNAGAVLFCYLICVGVLDAISHQGGMPAELQGYAAGFSWPAHVAGNLPIIDIPVDLIIGLGERIARTLNIREIPL
jgi:hypothetical protein